MYCRNCGKEIPEGSSGEYCGFCGERIDGTAPGAMHGKGNGGRWKNILIIVLLVLLLCALAAIGGCFLMFHNMSKVPESSGNEASYDTEAMGKIPPRGEGKPEGAVEGKPEGKPGEKPEEISDEDVSGRDQKEAPSFGNGDSGMPPIGQDGSMDGITGRGEGPGDSGGMRDEFGGRPGREMEEDWPGDDAGSAISSICGENGIPDGGEAVTDVSMLDGRWKVVLYDSTSDDLPAYYMGEVSREGNDLKLEISDPGQFLESGEGNTDPTGSYSGSLSTKNDRLSAELSGSSGSSASSDGGKRTIDIRNVFTSEGKLFASGVLKSGDGKEETYFVLFRPDRDQAGP